MISRNHPVRRCTPCDTNWPAHEDFNLCPRCQRNTYASTDEDAPNEKIARRNRIRYAQIRQFDAECDRQADTARKEWDAQMEALLAKTKPLPDPTGCAGLPPLRVLLEDERNAQDVTFHDKDEADNA